MMTFGAILSWIDRLPALVDGIARGSIVDLRLVARALREAAAKIDIIADCHEEVVQEPRVIAFPRRLRLVDGARR